MRCVGSLMVALLAATLGILFTSCATQPAPAPTQAPAVAPKGAEQAKTQAPLAVAKPETSTVRAGVMVIENLAPTLLAERNGYFRDNGLTVEPTTFVGGAEILPALAAGKLQFGYSAVVSALQGVSEGFDFVMVSGVVAVPQKPPDADVIMVRPDSTLKTAKDLEGKRVGINNVRNITWLYVRAWIEKNGGDPSKVQFVEVPFPQMTEALVNNRIDAGYSVEPFHTAALQANKAKVLADPYTDVQPGMDLAVWVASAKWAKENPSTVKAFVSAFSRAVDVVKDNPAERKKWAAEYAKLDTALLDKMVMAPLRTKIDAANLQKTADLMLKHGLLREKMDVSKLIWETAK